MKHGLTRDERRARARVVCACVGVALVAAGAALCLAHSSRHVTRAEAGTAAKLDAAPVHTAEVMPLEEALLYGSDGGAEVDDLDAIEMELPDTVPSIPEGGMFKPGAPRATQSALHASALVRHEGPSSAARVGGVKALAARADDYNETLVKRASFRSCWEASPGASGKVSLDIVVDPARGVSVHPVAAPEIPDVVVACVAARARILPLRAPPDGGPRTFNVSSSYVRPSM